MDKDSCTNCGVRFHDVGLKADRWCRRCGGPAHVAVAKIQRHAMKSLLWYDSLVLLAAALVVYLLPR